MEGIIASFLTDNVIKKYREDADLQNLIDFIQIEVEMHMDLTKDVYIICNVLRLTL